MKYRILILLITLPLAIPAFACMRQGSACYKHSAAYLRNKGLSGYEMAKVVNNFTKTQPGLQAMDIQSN